MGDNFNFGEKSKFNNVQFGGKNNIQMNIRGNYKNNQDLAKIEDIFHEFLQLRIDNEEWKLQFLKGLKDIYELRESDADEQKTKSLLSLKSLISKIYQKGKVANDWKNIVGLPSDFSKKIDSLLEIGSNLWDGIQS